MWSNLGEKVRMFKTGRVQKFASNAEEKKIL
jgi:hypothetical protein